ncbi:MAG: helix-turn-helix domain-containing protein [Chitinophagales bacterium]
MLQAAQNIKIIRELKNLTQEFVSSQLNLSVPSYSNIETGKTELTITRLQQIAKVLQIDYQQILQLDPSQMLNHSSPAPIVSAYALDQEILDELVRQLQIKDEQISRLLQIVQEKTSR